MATQSDYAVMAASVVESLFPPQNKTDVYRVAASLNLLNAIVKQPGGKAVTSYAYIKGMAACLFLWLLFHPVEGVQIYWDGEARVAYIRVGGRQFSFHYVPLLCKYKKAMKCAGLTEQLWDGVKLQLIAARLFCDAMPDAAVPEGSLRETLLQRMLGFGQWQLKEQVDSLKGVNWLTGQESRKRRKRITDISYCRYIDDAPERWLLSKSEKWYCLHLALKFNGWWSGSFELSRKGDYWRAKVACYTGDNYQKVADILVGQHPLVRRRSEELLLKGRHYFVRRYDLAWKRMTYSRYLLLVAHYNNLTVGDKRYNLCVTYGMARYLAFVYPELRFINVLNYTRLKVHRRIYTYRDLLRVPLHSKSRSLKVWLVVDKDWVLRDFDLTTLPPVLLREYDVASNYYQFFQKVYHKESVGLVAYSRFHLLPTVYAKIEVYGHYARVMDHRKKWAVYSLMKEEFETDFVYDSIWYDARVRKVFGCADDVVTEICKQCLES